MRIYAGKSSDFTEGIFRPVWIGEHCLGVGILSGRIVAFLSECPHRGAQLLQGKFHGNVISCPWHGWEFDLRTGRGLTNPHAQLERFPVSVEADGKVYVEIPEHWAYSRES